MTTRSAALSVLMTVVWIAAPGVAAETDDPAPSVTPPKFQFLRDLEDWSVLRDATEQEMQSDFWNGIKYIPLNDDGSVWLSLGGSTRFRLEGWNNFDFISGEDDAFLLWRTLLHADLHVGENFRGFIQGKSALSTERDLPGGTRTLDVDSIDLEQGFIDISAGDDVRFTFRPGRQALKLGKQRLVSPLGWSNTLRRWDGFRGWLTWDNWRVDGFWTQFAPVKKYEFNTPDADQPFYGAYATTTLQDLGDMGLDLYFLGRENSNGVAFNGTSGNEKRYTVGGRISGKLFDGAFDYDFEGAYQGGEVGDGDVSAYMIGSDFGWTFDPQLKSRIYMEFDLGSGDKTPGGDVETFNQLFPLGHRYLGLMDYIGRQNIVALTFGGEIKPTSKMTLRLAGLFFWRHEKADAVYNAGGSVLRAAGGSDEREVGQEIDFSLRYQFDRHLSGLLGYSHFFTGDFLEDTGPSSDSDFLYVQLEYTF